MIHHRRHNLITKRGKKKKPEEEKKVAKTRVVWRKKKKLVSAIRQKSNATRRVVNTPGPPLFNFNELAKIQDGPRLPLLRDSMLLCHGVKEAPRFVRLQV